MAEGDAPLRWDDRTNVRWTLELPGRGHSTPVIVGDRLFLTTAVLTGKGTAPTSRGRAGGGADAGLEHRFEVIAVERETGKIAWQRTATVATPHEGYHRVYGSFASNSPVSDGTRVFAFFGSRGLYAYDLDGTPLWQKDFGVKMRMDMAFGEGTPLTLHDNRLLLHFDHLDGGFLVMLDPVTGREMWRTKRTEPYNWAAPYVAEHEGRRQSIVSSLTVRSYDVDTGTLIWEAGGLGENTIPQPVQYDDLVFVMSGHTVRMLMAIRLGHTGDLTGTDAVVWSTRRGASYTPSPVLHQNRLYVLTDSGQLSCFNATTGAPLYQQARLPKPYNFKASPVGANGKLYLATEDEDVVVVKMGDTLEVLATNTMQGQSFIASPVIVDGDIYLRSRTHLFRIGKKSPSQLLWHDATRYRPGCPPPAVRFCEIRHQRGYSNVMGPFGALAVILKQAPVLLAAADALVARSRRASSAGVDIETLRQRVAELEQHQQANAALSKELADHAAVMATAVQANALSARRACVLGIIGVVLAAAAVLLVFLR